MTRHASQRSDSACPPDQTETEKSSRVPASPAHSAPARPRPGVRDPSAWPHPLSRPQFGGQAGARDSKPPGLHLSRPQFGGHAGRTRDDSRSHQESQEKHECNFHPSIGGMCEWHRTSQTHRIALQVENVGNHGKAGRINAPGSWVESQARESLPLGAGRWQ